MAELLELPELPELPVSPEFPGIPFFLDFPEIPELLTSHKTLKRERHEAGDTFYYISVGRAVE